MRLCAEHIPRENACYPTTNIPNIPFYYDNRIDLLKINQNLKTKTKQNNRLHLLLRLSFDAFTAHPRYIFHSIFEIYLALCSLSASSRRYVVRRKSSTIRSHGARDKKLPFIISPFLFIECLTFLPTFVNTIIFMYYVTKRGPQARRSQSNWPEQEPRSKLLKNENSVFLFYVLHQFEYIIRMLSLWKQIYILERIFVFLYLVKLLFAYLF